MMDEEFSARWKSNIKQLITEEIMCNSNGAGLVMPWRITFLILLQVAKTAIRIDDPELNRLMCDLSLYTVADGYHKDFDQKIVTEVDKLSHEFLAQLRKDNE